MQSKIKPHSTRTILAAMILGAIFGIILHSIGWDKGIISEIIFTGANLFMRLIKMLVVPVVFVSLVTGVSSLKNINTLGRIGSLTLFYYAITTAVAIAIAIFVATLSQTGSSLNLTMPSHIDYQQAPKFIDVLTDMIPRNPIKSLADGEMLQIIFFAVMFGVAINLTENYSKSLNESLEKINQVFMNMIMMCMRAASVGVFCLLAKAFTQTGFSALGNMVSYILVVLFGLVLQLAVTYSSLLICITRINPKVFFTRMLDCMLFAFSISSSSACIPYTMKTATDKLGVSEPIASFIVPMGATINMDGTAIMQGVATIFIANAYNVDIGVSGYITIIAMATMASIGTAGVPGVGIITLTMVLQQLGLPVEGVAMGMIFGVDRLLDMSRTAVNITGDALVSTLVAHHENQLDRSLWDSAAEPETSAAQ